MDQYKDCVSSELADCPWESVLVLDGEARGKIESSLGGGDRERPSPTRRFMPSKAWAAGII
jgi:hypothetical protein